MKPWNHRFLAIVLVAIMLWSGVGANLQPDATTDSRGAPPGAGTLVDAAARTWEGGGSRLQFVDTMDAEVARYYESMDPLDDGQPFDYYGGGISQVDSGEVFGLWQAERWRHEWWRWGEESLQAGDASGAGEPVEVWHLRGNVTDGALHFGEPSRLVYPGNVFSGMVSPVVDLRSVEPLRERSEGARQESLQQPSTGDLLGADSTIIATRQQGENTASGTGVVQVSDGKHIQVETPRVTNASAALRLRHEYGFVAVGNLQDGGRVEVSRLDPVRGWTDWQPLAPSPSSLRVGDDELEGRYSGALPGFGARVESTTPNPEGEGNLSVEPSAYADGANLPDGTTVPPVSTGAYLAGRPWLYQGRISASGKQDLRGEAWNGFGGQSDGRVDSVFDLTDHAGHLVRFRFLVATEAKSDNPNLGLGWMLDQMEVHAAGDSGIELVSSAVPTDGALLDESMEFHPVIAVQNTDPDGTEARLRFALEGHGSSVDTVRLGGGPWGRALHRMPDSFDDLLGGTDRGGLHQALITVASVMDLPGDAAAVGPTEAAGRIHFQVGGPRGEDAWRAVRVETEALPTGPEDDSTLPTHRLILRGQRMLVHVDVENVGPHPLPLELVQGDSDAPLWPVFKNTFGSTSGTMRITAGGETVTETTVMLPPSRDASGSLGQADALRRITWEWSGEGVATILDLTVDDPEGNRLLDGGSVRVETMEPKALSVDISNRWMYEDSPGCKRHLETQGRTGVLACSKNGAILSPMEPFEALDLRRGTQAHVVLVHRGGAGNITLETRLENDWLESATVSVPASPGAWNRTEKMLHTFLPASNGWIRVRVDGTEETPLLVDDLRVEVGPVEVGPEGKRFPLLWHNFDVDLYPETTGTLTSPSGDALAVLDGAALRPGRDEGGAELVESLDDEIDGGSGLVDDPVVYEEDALSLEVDSVVAFTSVETQVDTMVPGESVLQVNRSFVFDGARPTLRFSHWMGPSVDATGWVEVARLDSTVPPEARNQTVVWQSVASFEATPTEESPALREESIPLWEFLGSEVLVRFHYRFDPAKQPGINPVGWVIDDVRLEQTLPSPTGVQTLHGSRDTGFSDYTRTGVRLDDAVQGRQRFVPEINTTRERSSILFRENVACASPFETNTYGYSESAITDPLDLRTLTKPVLVLEHGGRIFHGEFGTGWASTRIIDLEYQILRPDGAWGPWHRATPHDTWETFPVTSGTPWSGRAHEENPFWLPNPTDGSFVKVPFTQANWGTVGPISDHPDETHYPHEKYGPLFVGDQATDFALEHGPAGEIARFRFHAWAEYNGSMSVRTCNPFQWNLYSMEVFEDTHVFDAAAVSIDVTPDDRDRLDLLSAGMEDRDLGEETAVVSNDRVFVDVRVRNEGQFSHTANVTLLLEGDDAYGLGDVVYWTPPGSLGTLSAVRMMPFNDRPFGSRVASSSPDGSFPVRSLPAAVSFYDVDGDGVVDADEPVYLDVSGSDQVDALDVRISVPGYPSGSQVHATDDDYGLSPLEPLGERGNVTFQDSDESSDLSASDALYLDLDGDQTVSTGDVRLTQADGHLAGSRVAAADADAGENLLGDGLDAGRFAFYDLDGRATSISFIDRSGGGLGIPRLGISHGPIDLEPSEEGVATFRVEFNRMPPGDYTLRAVVDLEDALDTNPRNDVASRPVQLLPFRALSFDRSTTQVSPFADTPEAGRVLRLDLRNQGNIDETAVEVHAKVVELVGVTLEKPLEGPGLGSEGYVLTSKTLPASGLPRRGGTAPLTWDLQADGPGADLRQILRPGVRYAVNITLHPATDSVTSWWDHSDRPLAAGPDGLLRNLAEPTSRCGCYQIPFLVEGLVAESDLTAGGTSSVLDGYLPDGGLGGWNVSIRTQVDGAWVDASNRTDLEGWRVIDEAKATLLAGGAKADGPAWHLPAFQGFERVEHQLVSPPLPAHVINSTSRPILDLHYASGLEEDQGILEVRTLEPGGRWGEWEPIDGLRSKRVAVVLSPDYPRVFSDKFGDGGFHMGARVPDKQFGHPVPPVYKNDEFGSPQMIPCQNCMWSPFPNFREPDNPGNDASLEALGDVLQALAGDPRVGPGNVGVFTTLSDEFDVRAGPWARHHLGVEYVPGDVPALHVKNAETPGAPHVLPIQDLDALGLRLDSYNTILLMGDGLTRYASDQSASLAALSNPSPDADLTVSNTTIFPEDADWDWPPALDQHFPDLFEILRTAPAAGVQVIGAIGPAPATVAMSGIAEGVPMSLWIPPNSPVSGGQILPNPWSLRCQVEHPGHGGNPGAASVDAVVNISYQPKGACFTQSSFGTNIGQRNYRYVSGPDAQASALRDFMAQGQAPVRSRQVQAGASDCAIQQAPGVVQFSSFYGECAVPIPHTTHLDADSGVTFVTAAANATQWIGNVLAAVHADGTLPAGTGTWDDLPHGLSTPLGGRFVRDAQGGERFEGETLQFRLTVRSDPDVEGHGLFLLDRFTLLGTPRDVPDLHVRVADPRHLSLRDPGEPGFFVTVEALNRGTVPVDPTTLQVWMNQTEDGHCDGDCVVHALYPPANTVDSSRRRVLEARLLGPGERHIITIGGPAMPLPPDAPPGIQADRQSGPFLNGRFPDFPNGVDRAEHESRFQVSVLAASGHPSTTVDSFLAENDRHSVIVRGHRSIEPLVKHARDVRLVPDQAPRAETDTVQIRLHLVNDGSTKNLVGRATARVEFAAPHDCPIKNVANPFTTCDADGDQTRVLWTGATDPFQVPRGGHLDTSLPIPLAEAGISAGVYRVSVEIMTDPDGEPLVQSFERFLYLGEGDEHWAFYREDLEDVTTNADVWDRAFPPDSNATSDEDEDIHGDDTTPCRADLTTREGTQPNQGKPLLHGWRASGAVDSMDPCVEFRDDSDNSLHWLRSAAKTTEAGATWTTRDSSQAMPEQVGFGDFGPDAVVWYPGQQEDAVLEAPGAVNGVAETLARFQEGDAALVLSTRFEATPNTAYVVEMQVPVRACMPSITGGLNCAWQWNWGAKDGNHWFPLQSSTPGVTDAEAPVISMNRTAQDGTCEAPDSGSPIPPPSTCRRKPGPTNPLGGLPGIWGGSSVELPGADEGGWVSIRYPIDPGMQDHIVYGDPVPTESPFDDPSTMREDPLYTGLEAYCEQLAVLGGDFFPSSPETPLRKCMYTLGHEGREIPRPVAFRLRAASFGGDEGANRWQVREFLLTSHDLAVEGPTRFPIHLVDGETKRVPVLFRNAGTVDDPVRVAATIDEKRKVDGTSVQVSRHATSEPKDHLDLTVAAGTTLTVWAHVQVGLGAGNLDPGTDFDLPVQVTARSTVATGVAATAFIDAKFRNLERADIVIDTVDLDGSTQGMHGASQGVPVHATLLVRNEGLRPVSGEPVLVRLVAERLDPSNTTQVLWREVVDTSASALTLERGCFFDRCAVPVTLTWTPEEQGLYFLRAEVNLPRAGDSVAQIPERDSTNNVHVRSVKVGAVPLADLQVLDVRLVPFEEGCADVSRAVDRLIDGRSYCVAATVANHGSLGAVHPSIEFSVGAADAFSRGAPTLDQLFDDANGVFPSGETVLSVSTPRRAFLPLDGSGELEFRVQVETASASASVEGKERIVALPVEDYALELVSGDSQHVELLPGETTRLRLTVRNTGTAVATPTASTAGGEGLRVHMVQPPPLQPGEQTDVTIAVTAAHALPQQETELAVVLSTVEDPNAPTPSDGVAVPLSVHVAVLDRPASGVALMPLHAAPGNASLEVALDNSGWNMPGTWTPLWVSGPLALDAGAFQTDAHDVGVHALPVTIPGHTPPGVHEGAIAFQVGHGTFQETVHAPYTLRVTAAPLFGAGLEASTVNVTAGSQATIRVSLQNDGNVPVEAVAESHADSGDLRAFGDRFVLEPGDVAHATVLVTPGQPTRILGNTTIQWRVVGEDAWNTTGPLLWAVEQRPAQVLIRGADLEGLSTRKGTPQTIQVLVENLGSEELTAEVSLVVDEVLHHRVEVVVGAGDLESVQLLFQSAADRPQTLQVIARPVGSSAVPTDPVFHSVGDITVHTVEPETGGSFLPVPGLGASGFLAALAVAVLLWGRRRP